MRKKVIVGASNKETEKLPFPQFDIDMVNQLIRQRRSIFPKDYSDEPVTHEEIEMILENAHWAPNHGKTEPWFFKVYSGDARAPLGEARAELYKKLTPVDKYDEKKYEKIKKRPTEAQYYIALCLKAGTNPKIPLLEEQAALAAAVQNMHLTATALGLAAYWSSGAYALRPETAKLLGLGENESCMGFFMVARPKVKDSWPKGYRKADWEEKVEWVG